MALAWSSILTATDDYQNKLAQVDLDFHIRLLSCTQNEQIILFHSINKMSLKSVFLALVLSLSSIISAIPVSTITRPPPQASIAARSAV